MGVSIIDASTFDKFDKKSVSTLEFLLMQFCLVFIIWLIRRSCLMKNLIIVIDNRSLKYNLILTFSLYLLQLGIGIIEVLCDPPQTSSKDHRVYYGCLAEYSLLFFVSWTLSAYVTITNYCSSSSSFERGLTFFWGYFGVMHFIVAILKSFTSTSAATEIVEICLHIAILLGCIAMEVSYIKCGHSNSQTHIGKFQDINSDSSKELIVNEYRPLRIYVKKCKQIGNEILYTLIAVINGDTTKVKVTYKELQAFDSMVGFV